MRSHDRSNSAHKVIAGFKLWLLLSIGVLLNSIVSCAPVLYGTQGQNVPMLKAEGDVYLSAGHIETNESSGEYANAAYAISEKTALMASSYKYHGGNTGGWSANAKFQEFGIGRFFAKKDQNWVFDVYTGLGYASINNYSDNNDFIDVNYSKWFVQSSYGSVGRIAEFAFTLRLAKVTYAERTCSLIDEAQQLAIENFFNENNTFFVYEPGFTFRIGPPYVKVELQVVTSNFSHRYGGQDLADNTHASLGLAFNWREYQKRVRKKAR